MSIITGDSLDYKTRLLILKGINERKVYTGPIHVELDPTNRCNCKCFFCPQRLDNKEISIGILEKTLLELKNMGLKNVRISGGGEPLMYKNLSRLLQCIYSNKLVIDNITTNGTLINDRLAEELVEYNNVDTILISLNASNERAYSELMGIGRNMFFKALSSLEKLAKTKKKYRIDKPIITIQFLVWKNNYKDIDEMLQLGESLNIDAIFIRDIYNLPRRNQMTPEEIDIFKKHLLAVLKKFRKFVKLYFPILGIDQYISSYGNSEYLTPYSDTNNKVKCYVGWYDSVIDAHGDVYPCCMLLADRSYRSIFGNIYKENFRKIWLGEKYKRFRGELIKSSNVIVRLDDFEFLTPFCNICGLKNAIFSRVVLP